MNDANKEVVRGKCIRGTRGHVALGDSKEQPSQLERKLNTRLRIRGCSGAGVGGEREEMETRAEGCR